MVKIGPFCPFCHRRVWPLDDDWYACEKCGIALTRWGAENDPSMWDVNPRQRLAELLERR